MEHGASSTDSFELYSFASNLQPQTARSALAAQSSILDPLRAVCCPLLAVCCLLSAACCLLPAVFIAHCLLSLNP
jgi:hypothetical protein